MDAESGKVQTEDVILSDADSRMTKRFETVQKVVRPGGTVGSSMCLTKAAVGAGVLSITFHSAQVGFGYTLGCLIVGGILTVISIRMIASAAIATKSWSFEDICEELFHPVMSFVTGFINVCNCLGAAAGYLIVCGQVFTVLTGASDSMRKLFVVLMGLFVCAPLALARHVSFMRHLAMLSIAAICLLVITVVTYFGEHGVHESINPETFWAGSGGATVFTYMNTINIIVFAYNNQFNVPQLTSELTPEPHAGKMTVVSLISTVICLTLYSSVCVFGTLAFGVGSDQKDTLILDLYPARQTALVQVTLIAVMFSVLTCFQFHIYPIRQFLAYAVRKSRGMEAGDDEKDVQYWGTSLTRWIDMACAVIAVLFAVVIAVAITELKTILDFVGAFAGAWVSFIIPPLFIIQLRRQAKDTFTWLDTEMTFCVAFLCLGIFLFVFGTYAAIVG